MRVKMKRTKSGMTISIRANPKGSEGVDLKDAVMSIAGKAGTGETETITGIFRTLGEKGYRADGPLTDGHPEINLLKQQGGI